MDSGRHTTSLGWYAWMSLILHRKRPAFGGNKTREDPVSLYYVVRILMPRYGSYLVMSADFESCGENTRGAKLGQYHYVLSYSP
ncbi:hypothetical protein M3J09_013163 [Ascochyta lentis]